MVERKRHVARRAHFETSLNRSADTPQRLLPGFTRPRVAGRSAEHLLVRYPPQSGWLQEPGRLKGG
jgi:hypothetical protein